MPRNTVVAAVTGDLILLSKLRSLAETRRVHLRVAVVPEQIYSVLEHKADGERIVAVDVDSPSFNGVEVVQQLKQRFPSVRVLGFCYNIDTDLVRRTKNARIDGLFTREQFEQLFVRMLDVLADANQSA